MGILDALRLKYGEPEKDEKIPDQPLVETSDEAPSYKPENYEEAGTRNTIYTAENKDIYPLAFLLTKKLERDLKKENLLENDKPF